LSSEKHKVASGVKNTFPFVDFARCQPRVTYLAELVDKAAELEWNPTSGELLTRHVAKRKGTCCISQIPPPCFDDCPE
jgi:hypothetical protein